MKMPKLEFFFDYRSPYSYLARSQLEPLAAEVSYHPFDILDLMKRVENVPTSVICKPKTRYLMKDLQRWSAIYGVPVNRHPGAGNIDGRRLLRATIAAGHHRDVAKAVAAIFAAYWREPKPLETAAEVARLLGSAGYDVARLEAEIDGQDLDAALNDATTRAV